jgi:hypothetical protein
MRNWALEFLISPALTAACARGPDGGNDRELIVGRMQEQASGLRDSDGAVADGVRGGQLSVERL